VDEANAAAAKRCHGGQGHRQREIQRHRGIRRRTALRQNLVCCRHGAGFIGDDRAVKGLIAALRDREHDVRRLAAEALARQAAPEAIPRLVECLADDDEAVREAAAGALTRIGVASLPRVLTLVRREGDRRRPRPRLLLAAQVAGRVGDERAIEPLAVMLVQVAPHLGASPAHGPIVPALRQSAALRQPMSLVPFSHDSTSSVSISNSAGLVNVSSIATSSSHQPLSPSPGLTLSN